jgi:flavin reductase (NADH)
MDGFHPFDAEAFKEALSHWASTVTVVALRDGDSVQAVTVSSFAPVSADPPAIVVSLGPTARILPFVREGGAFTVNLLAEDQRGVARNFADSFPVGPDPFPADGPPVLEGAVLTLLCSVHRMVEVAGGGQLVVGRVEGATEGSGDRPLLYHRRGYERLG